MKIKMLQSIAGHEEPRYDLRDFSFPPGAVIEVRDELAKAWIAADIAIAAERGAKLTMPVEVYTAKTKPAPDFGIDYAKAALFLQSRGYEVRTPADAVRFVAGIEAKNLSGFLGELEAFDPAAEAAAKAEAEAAAKAEAEAAAKAEAEAAAKAEAEAAAKAEAEAAAKAESAS